MRQLEVDSTTTSQLATRIPKDLHHRIKIAAFKEDVTLRDWVGEALAAYLEKVTTVGAAAKESA